MSQQDSFSYDDSSWSEDAFESEDLLHQRKEMVLKQHPHEGRKDLKKSISYGRGKAVGVAYPFKQTPGKISQVVKPTFGSQPNSRKHCSSEMNTYVEVENNHPTTSISLPNENKVFSNSMQLVAKANIASNATTTTKDQNSLKKELFHEMTSFSPPKFEKSFPPPPYNLTFNTQPQKKPLGGSSIAIASDSYSPIQAVMPSSDIAVKSNNQVLQSKSFLAKKTFEKNGRTVSNHSLQNVVVQSVSNESTSSGFLSSSPQISIIQESTTNESTYPASNEADKTIQTKHVVAENVYDKVVEELPGLLECGSRKSSSETTSFCQEDVNLDYPNPEYCYEPDECKSEDSQDDEGSNIVASSGTTYKNHLKKTKKSMHFFWSKKNKKSKKNYPVHNDETFFSPSYDDEPVVPVVEGWQEIDYCADTSLAKSDGSMRSSDDSCLYLSEKKKCKEQEHVFFTLRPKNHLRQKLPKLRRTGRQWSAGNNPRPVPTPSVPTASVPNNDHL